MSPNRRYTVKKKKNWYGLENIVFEYFKMVCFENIAHKKTLFYATAHKHQKNK